MTTPTHELGRVPVVPLVNRARTLAPDGRSEIADLLPLFDSASKLATDLMVASEYLALPRRYATGLELEELRDPVTGAPTGQIDPDQLDPTAGRTWLAESPDARFGQLPGADLGAFTTALRALTEALAAAASLPPHMLGITTANPASADAIRSAEAGLVSKVRRRMRAFESAWEESLRMAVAIRDGRYDPRLESLTTQWSDPEVRTVGMAADAAVKLHGAGIIPAQAAAVLAGFTPDEVAQHQTMRRAEALNKAGVDLSAVLP